MEMRNISKEDLIWVFEFEHGRTKTYFDLMYRSLQFTFAAAIAVLVMAFGAEIEEEAASLLLTLILPVCIYIFGMLYAFNAYSLAVCGKRAEIIRNHIFDSAESESDPTDESAAVKKILVTYVGNNRWVSLISYGVALGCFIVAPIVSFVLGCTIFRPYNGFVKLLSVVGLILYMGLMTVMVVAIGINYHQSRKIQEKVLASADTQGEATGGH